MLFRSLVGFLMQTQRKLMIKQEENQAALAEHAVTDERRRIAREVHDVIAHSLSVTLLHVTAARRALQQDRELALGHGHEDQIDGHGKGWVVHAAHLIS